MTSTFWQLWPDFRRRISDPLGAGEFNCQRNVVTTSDQMTLDSAISPRAIEAVESPGHPPRTVQAHGETVDFWQHSFEIGHESGGIS